MLIEQPDRLYAANRKLRELRGNDARLARILSALNAEDFSRADYQAIFHVLEKALRQDELDTSEYLYRHLSPELGIVLQALQVPPQEMIQKGLPRSLMAELPSIVREQSRVNTLPEANTDLFVKEALELRLRRLERELDELYFYQMDMQDKSNINGDYHQDEQKAHIVARQLVVLALRSMRSIYRET